MHPAGAGAVAPELEDELLLDELVVAPLVLVDVEDALLLVDVVVLLLDDVVVLLLDAVVVLLLPEDVVDVDALLVAPPAPEPPEPVLAEEVVPAPPPTPAVVAWLVPTHPAPASRSDVMNASRRQSVFMMASGKGYTAAARAS